jgi:hypothetical protein
MTTLPINTPPDEPQADDGKRSRSSSEIVIRDGVIALLGRPPELYRVAVIHLWASCYRVNVLVGFDPTALRVVHSFFVETGEGGHIVKATPPITRLYP